MRYSAYSVTSFAQGTPSMPGTRRTLRSSTSTQITSIISEQHGAAGEREAREQAAVRCRESAHYLLNSFFICGP